MMVSKPANLANLLRTGKLKAHAPTLTEQVRAPVTCRKKSSGCIATGKPIHPRDSSPMNSHLDLCHNR